MSDEARTRGGRLIKSSRMEDPKGFRASHALIIGINDYSNGITRLTTPVNDATRLAKLLENQHGYTTHLLVKDVAKARIQALLTQELPPQVGEDDRLLLYFAGHGVALDGDDGPRGYLLPQDARPDDATSLLAMTDLHAWLDDLLCRHMLAILDCCFAGAFRWASTRQLGTAALEVIHRERYERFLQSPAWQVLTSAAYDQQALDVFAGKAVGSRGVRELTGERHSPFALALYEALQGEGDLIPKDGGDGVITATELYLYLREQVEVGVEKEVGHLQTPGLWPLNKHGRGEYIFLTPGHELNLPPAPELTFKLNPWRGLKSYDQRHSKLFFGRDQEIQQLAARVGEQSFTAVLGASGTGKSSLVKAGLLPHLVGARQQRDGGKENNGAWFILPPLRPGATPLLNLHRLLAAQLTDFVDHTTLADLREDPQKLADLIVDWREANPGRMLLLLVDQLEELVTLCQEQARNSFLALLGQAIAQQPDTFRLIITLRTDFEPQFTQQRSPLAGVWRQSRYVVPPMDQADLRQVIEGPASERVLYFEPPGLVDDLITEVIQTPGALPLLSFTLSELYIRYVKSGRDDRALAQEEYDALGGVIGSLRNCANQEYEALPDDVHRETMRRVMLRMISVEGGELARRRVQRSELVYSDENENRRVDAVLDRLVEARLLVTGQEEGEATAEPAHDALVLAWDRLLRWKKAAEEYLTLQRRLSQAATEWRQAGPEARSGFLWDDDPRLPTLAGLLPPDIIDAPMQRSTTDTPSKLRTPKPLRHFSARATQFVDRLRIANAPPDQERWLNALETDFIWHSVRRRWRNTRLLWGSVITAFAIVAALALVANSLRVTANTEANARATAEADAVGQANALATEVLVRTTAEVQADTARSTAEAEANARATQVVIRTTAEADADRSARAEATAAADARLKQAQAEHEARRAQAGELAALAQAAAATFPQRSLLLAVEALRVSQTAAEEPTTTVLQTVHELLAEIGGQPLPGHEAAVGAAVSSGDGRWLATGSEDETVRVWDMASKAAIAVLPGHQGGVADVAISPDGQWLASASADDYFRLWRLADLAADPLILFRPASQSSNEFTPHIAFTPENRWVLVTSAGEVQFGDADGRGSTEPTRLSDPTSGLDSIRVFAVSPDGRWLADVIGYREQAVLWDLANPQRPPAILEGHTTPINALVFSPDSNWLATGSGQGSPWTTGDYTVRLWDPSNPVEASHVLEGHASYVLSLAFSPDGTLLASGSSDQTVRIWDMERLDAKPLVLMGFEGPVPHLVFSRDSRQLAASSGNTIRVWQRNTYGGVGTTPLKGHEGQVNALVYATRCEDQVSAANCTNVLISASADDALRLWEPSNPTAQPQSWADDSLGFYINRFSPDGQWAASALRRNDNSYALRWWALPDGEPVTLQVPREVAALDFTPDSAALIVIIDGTNDGLAASAQLLDVQEARGSGRPLVGYEGPFHALALSPDGRWLAIASGPEGGRVHLWKSEAPEALPVVVPGDPGPISDLLFSPDSRWLAMVGDDTRVYLWDVQQPGAQPVQFSERSKLVTFSPESRLLISSPDDGTARLYTRENLPSQFVTLKGPQGTGPHLAAFSPDRKWLTMGSSDLSYGDPDLVDHAVRLWDLDHLEPDPMILADEEAGLRDLMFSPDGRWLARLDYPKGVRLWDIQDLAANPAIFRGLQGNFMSVDFSPDGDWLVTGIDNDWPLADEVRLWNLQNPAVQPILLPSSASTYLAFSPQGRWLVGGLQLWRFHPDDLSAAACASAGRNLTLEEWRQVMADEPYRKTCPQGW